MNLPGGKLETKKMVSPTIGFPGTPHLSGKDSPKIYLILEVDMPAALKAFL